MSKRFWLLGLAGLIGAALLVACGSNYNSSSNGLVLVGSQGSSVVQTYGFDLNSGDVSSIANSTNDTGGSVCIMNGLPASMVVEPTGHYAYVIVNPATTCPNSITQPGIATFQIKSDGTIAQVGNLLALNAETINSESVAVNPYTLSVDSAGKFLFVANRATADSSNNPVPGVVSVLTIGSAGALTEVAGSPFFVPLSQLAQRNADIAAVAATPTVFPGTGINGTLNSVCSPPSTPPTVEYLYAVDASNYLVWEFSVDMSSGVLTIPSAKNTVFPTDPVPAGIAVDPCDRFVYVSGGLNSRINAYQICSAVNANAGCPLADYSLVNVSGSPFSVSGSPNGLGPILVDPFGNNVYVLGTLSDTVSAFKISPVAGSLTALNPATVNTGFLPKSMVIRADNNWLFVSNYGSATVSQYSITPASGALRSLPAIQTDNNPFGVAVK